MTETRGGGAWFSIGFRFGVAAAAELQPRALDGAGGAVLGVRPSWSFVGLRRGEAEGAASGQPREPPAASPVSRQAAPGSPRVLLLPPPPRRGLPRWWSPLPSDCLDVLPSETHLLLLRRSPREGWALPGSAEDGGAGPEWRRALSPEEAAGTDLPLVPGGYVVPRPPFFEPLPPALRARSLALGHEHAVLLSAAGAVFAWGGGRHGQLGHGDLEDRAEPRPVEALQGLSQGRVAAGGWHSASVSETGDLYLWGWNESGQLALPAKSVAEEETAGPEVRRGILERNLEDQVDPGQSSHRTAFISIQAFPALLDLPQGAEVRKISCGSRHTAAVTAVLADGHMLAVSFECPYPFWRWQLRKGAGDLYTWGWGKYGQLGHGDRETSDRPRRVCYFADRSLCVTKVVCGPWATYVRAVDQEESEPL